MLKSIEGNFDDPEVHKLLTKHFVELRALSRTERKIVEKVKSLDQESISFLEKVVNINSGTLNQKGVKEVGQ